MLNALIDLNFPANIQFVSAFMHEVDGTNIADLYVHPDTNTVIIYYYNLHPRNYLKLMDEFEVQVLKMAEVSNKPVTMVSVVKTNRIPLDPKMFTNMQSTIAIMSKLMKQGKLSTTLVLINFGTAANYMAHAVSNLSKLFIKFKLEAYKDWKVYQSGKLPA